MRKPGLKNSLKKSALANNEKINESALNALMRFDPAAVKKREQAAKRKPKRISPKKG